MSWIGPLLVAPLWGIGSTQLLLRCWLATAEVFIALAALVRGRMPGARAFEVVLGAFITGAFCSVGLRAGFFVLVEILEFGHTRLEQVVFGVFVALAAAFMLRGLPSRLGKSWRSAMSPAVP